MSTVGSLSFSTHLQKSTGDTFLSRTLKSVFINGIVRTYIHKFIYLFRNQDLQRAINFRGFLASSYPWTACRGGQIYIIHEYTLLFT